MKHFFLSALLFALLFTAEAEHIPGKLLFSFDFNNYDSLKCWSGASNMKWEPTGGKNNSGCVSFNCSQITDLFAGIDLPMKSVSGELLVLEGWIDTSKLAAPQRSYLGPKVILAKEYPGGTGTHEIKKKEYGVPGWRRFLITCDVPPVITRVTLKLGVQGTVGTLRFDDLKIYKLSKKKNVKLRPEFRAKKLQKSPQYRGVMSGGDFSEKAFQTLRDWNVNLMRFQITSNGIENITEAGFRAGVKRSLERFDRVLPLARKYGIKMILDLHYGPGTGINKVYSNSLNWEPAQQKLLIQIWREIASRYKNEPLIYGYDILNEPREDHYEYQPGNDRWQGLAEKICAAIREIDPHTPIIVEPILWGSIAGLKQLQPIQQPNIIYSFHFYDPHIYTHQNVPGLKNNKEWTYPGIIGGVLWNREKMYQEIQPVIDFQKKHNVPIFVGEFSAVRWAPGADLYLKDLISIFEENGWDWTYHAFREWRGWSLEAYDNRGNEKFNPDMNKRKKVVLEAFAKNLPISSQK